MAVAGKSEDERIKKKRIVIALGHEALGATLPEQKEAARRTAKAIVDFIGDLAICSVLITKLHKEAESVADSRGTMIIK